MKTTFKYLSHQNKKMMIRQLIKLKLLANIQEKIKSPIKRVRRKQMSNLKGNRKRNLRERLSLNMPSIRQR
jgi:hypothetical protein